MGAPGGDVPREKGNSQVEQHLLGLETPPCTSEITGRSDFTESDKHSTEEETSACAVLLGEQMCAAGPDPRRHHPASRSPPASSGGDGRSDTEVWTEARRDWRTRRDGV